MVGISYGEGLQGAGEMIIYNPNDEQLSAWLGEMVLMGHSPDFMTGVLVGVKGRPPNTIYWPDDWPDLDDMAWSSDFIYRRSRRLLLGRCA